MRQPEVVRLATLAVAVVLVVPLAAPLRTSALAAAFLTEFLTGGSIPALSRVTAEPVRRAMALRNTAVDRYALPHSHGRPLVLVHGLAPDGKDDPRLRAAATLFARAGFDVAVPTIPGLTRLRLRPEDRKPVVTTIRAFRRPAIVVGVSIGAGVAMLAAAEPAARDRVAMLLSLGGYASARDLVRFYLTGDYAWDGVSGHVTHDPELIRLFLAENADILDASAQRVLASRDAASLAGSLGALSPELTRLLDAVSPELVVGRLAAPLILVHGRGDVAVPYTETLRLAAARPQRTRVILVGIVGHVEGDTRRAHIGALVDVLRLWAVMYSILSAA